MYRKTMSFFGLPKNLMLLIPKSNLMVKKLQFFYIYSNFNLPNWHQGFGGDAFIFVDEIEVK